MSSQLIGAFPVFATSSTLKRLGVTSDIFYVGEMLLVQVQVKSAFVVAMRAANQCGGDVRSGFFFFFFTVGPVLGQDCTLEY